jgi:hypothetical protein
MEFPPVSARIFICSFRRAAGHVVTVISRRPAEKNIRKATVLMDRDFTIGHTNSRLFGAFVFRRTSGPMHLW